MAKFDRKKFREEQFKKSQQVEYNDPLENFEGSKTELLFLKFSRFFSRHRSQFFIGIGIFIAAIVTFVAVGEYLQYRTNQATIQIEKVERKHAKASSVDTKAKIKDYEVLLEKYSSKEAKLRIYKRISDLHVEAFEFSKAAEYLEKVAELVADSKEIKAYYYYVAGSHREKTKDNKLALQNYFKASTLLTNNRETHSLSAWTYYQIGRLRLLNGEKEAGIKDLNKVLDIESEATDLAEVKKLATYLLIKANKG
jgi:tetratricopeptide (TPR) repeat protein